MKRMVVIGAGAMARVRAQALLATGRVELCGVAARRLESAERFAADFGCPLATDDAAALASAGAEAALVEVPHGVQDDLVLGCLERGLSVLIGGVPATSVATVERIAALAAERGRVVETGFQARYSAMWHAARERIAAGALGDVVAARSIALWSSDPDSWYYSQAASGGMPLTHMTYCFVNPVRWLLGNPLRLSALANRKHHVAAHHVDQETCIANLLLPGDVLYSATAGFVLPGGELPHWSVTILGTRAALELHPAEDRPEEMVVYGPDGAERIVFAEQAEAFARQAAAFVAALDGRASVANPPDDAVWDVRIAEAIVESARSGRMIDLP